jgi:hypothetical protein
MARRGRCIYCGEEREYCVAHILPESLGKFKGQPLQKSLICAECDREIGRSEEQLVRSGVEAIHKARLSIKGKRKHKPSFPFRRKYAGQGPIELKARHPGADYDVFVEPVGDGQNVQPVPQIVLLGSNGEHHSVRLPDPMKTTPQDLRTALRNSPLKGEIRIETVELSENEINYVFDLFQDIGVSIRRESTSPDDPFSGPQSYPNVCVQGTIVVDTRYFRAIAKIGFHYFIQFSEYFFGGEECFAPLREFIRYGKGKSEDFVSWRRGNLVADLNYGLRPRYYGHFIIGDFSGNAATAYVQLFIGKDNNPPYYKIDLGKDCLRTLLQNRIFGHFYAYYHPEKRSQYTGEIEALGATHRIQMPDRFRVDYRAR